MAESTTAGPGAPQASVAPTLAPAAARGRLVVTDRVVDRTALGAALAAPGVARRGSGAARLAGRSLPRVEVRRGDDRVRVRLEVALAWPTPLAATTAAVRDSVAATLARVTGLEVEGVDVTVTHLSPEEDLR